MKYFKLLKSCCEWEETKGRFDTFRIVERPWLWEFVEGGCREVAVCGRVAHRTGSKSWFFTERSAFCLCF